MLSFLRFACLALALAAAAPALAQDPPASAMETTAPAPAAAPPGPAAASTASPPFRDDAPKADDLRYDRSDSIEGSESLLGSLLKMVVVLGLVLALVYLTLNWGLRKLMRLGPARGALVKVHERVPLDAKKTVCLVEVGDEFLLLGVGEHEVSLLTRLDPVQARATLAKRSEPSALARATGKPFWERLRIKPPVKGSVPPSGEQGGPPPT